MLGGGKRPQLVQRCISLETGDLSTMKSWLTYIIKDQLYTIALLLQLTMKLQSAASSNVSFHSPADFGGNRGWALGLSNTDDYASVKGYFSDASYWPTHEITISAWLRFLTLEKTGRHTSFVFSMISRGDTNHVQPFFIEIVNGYLKISSNVATTSTSLALPKDAELWKYWTKITVTYVTTGSASLTAIYLNGTQLGNMTSTGKVLRWSDESTLIIGGYALGSTSTLIKSRFIGWIDDLSFYNRALNASEIATTWQLAGNVSDPSLFIYYDFDDGPGSDVIKNHGTAGAQADIYNGEMFGSHVYYDTVGQTMRTITKAAWVSAMYACTVCMLLYEHDDYVCIFYCSIFMLLSKP